MRSTPWEILSSWSSPAGCRCRCCSRLHARGTVEAGFILCTPEPSWKASDRAVCEAQHSDFGRTHGAVAEGGLHVLLRGHVIRADVPPGRVRRARHARQVEGETQRLVDSVQLPDLQGGHLGCNSGARSVLRQRVLQPLICPQTCLGQLQITFALSADARSRSI